MSGRGPPGPSCAPGGRAADPSEILAVSFNQDQSCLAVATTRGVKIFSLDAGLECVFEHHIGACRIAEMLFRSSLLVVVGAGETHDMSPRRLKMFNTSTRTVIADIPFPETIAAVRLDRQKLVVVEARRATVFDLATLAAQREIATAPNERGVVAMTADETEETSLVALPADAFDLVRSKNAAAGDVDAAAAKEKSRASRLGVVVVHDCLNHHAVCEIRAHRAPLAAMAFCSDGSLLATASERGTVVRVHVLPAADEKNARTFRRGVSSAVVRQLAFGAAPGGGLALAASSNKGTVHVFELCSASAARAAGKGDASPRGSRAADPARDSGSATETGDSRSEPRSRALARRALGVGAAATAKLAGAVSAKLAGLAFGREIARCAADALDAEREVATVRLPAVSEGCEVARAKAAARGGFGVAGACAVRGAARGASASSICVVAVNGDALLCEYAVRLDGDASRVPALERERCVARASVTAPDDDAAAAAETEDDTRTARRGAETETDNDDDVGLCGPSALDPADPMDLSASMSASMGQSLFLAKKTFRG